MFHLQKYKIPDWEKFIVCGGGFYILITYIIIAKKKFRHRGFRFLRAVFAPVINQGLLYANLRTFITDTGIHCIQAPADQGATQNISCDSIFQ